MAHIGRTVKNVEAPRPLKSQSRASLRNNYMLIEELIQLIENVALTLQSGINNTEPMASLVQNLRVHGPQLETVSKDTLDRAFVVFRNASQDERLNIMTRLNLLELIELRAKGWEDNGFNSYYKTKQASNVETPDIHQQPYHYIDSTQAAFPSTSPTFGAGSTAAVVVAGSAQQQQLLLGPGELIRNSGKFPKPTKIPGKTYCKDEVVIRNADSGKVMGIKGRRVHMIEELSETIISFQRVNPGAKERLVQITGPSEEKINYAKQLIEDTIRRNASPVRLDPAMGAQAGGSCSSLASSNSDDAATRVGGAGSGTSGGGLNITNRLSLNSAQNFMTATAAAQQVAVAQQQAAVAALLAKSTSSAAAAAAAGEYKYTVNVGQHVIKITGDCCDLVRVAKLVLDDYFCSAEFLVSVEAGAAFDTPISPSTPMGQPQYIVSPPLLADSGVGLNYMAGQISNSNNNNDDDDVFADSNGFASSQNNALARSRRSHFSRKDSTPEAVVPSTMSRYKSHGDTVTGRINMDTNRIVHEYEHLLYYAKSPHSWALPANWQDICDKFPAIVRNKVTNVSTKAKPSVSVANIATSASSNGNNNSISAANAFSVISTSSNEVSKLIDENISVQLNIRHKGYLNRQTLSIDEDCRTAELLEQQLKLTRVLTQTPHPNKVPSFAAASAVPAAATSSTQPIFHFNNNIRSTITPSPPFKESKIQKKLLDKQIKFISSITESSAKKSEQNDFTSVQQVEPILIEDSDDEFGNLSDEGGFEKMHKDMEPEFPREYRSNSTCN